MVGVTYRLLIHHPSLVLHEVRIENDTNNLLIALSSNIYDNIDLSRIDVPLGNIALTDHTNYYLVAESNKGLFTWYFDSIHHHQQPMLY
jgi:hypothetical protein